MTRYIIAALILLATPLVAQTPAEQHHGWVAYTLSDILPKDFDGYKAGNGVVGTTRIAITQSIGIAAEFEYTSHSLDSHPSWIDGFSFDQYIARVAFSPALAQGNNWFLFLNVGAGYTFTTLGEGSLFGFPIDPEGSSGGSVHLGLNLSIGPMLLGAVIEQNINKDYDSPAVIKGRIGVGF